MEDRRRREELHAVQYRRGLEIAELVVYKNWSWELVGDLTAQTGDSELGFEPPYHPDQSPETDE